jgi:hypothetical protein
MSSPATSRNAKSVAALGAAIPQPNLVVCRSNPPSQIRVNPVSRQRLRPKCSKNSIHALTISTMALLHCGLVGFQAHAPASWRVEHRKPRKHTSNGSGDNTMGQLFDTGTTSRWPWKVYACKHSKCLPASPAVAMFFCRQDPMTLEWVYLASVRNCSHRQLLARLQNKLQCLYTC